MRREAHILGLTLLLSGMIFWTAMSEAAHPLITDDTGTQGKSKSQLELNGEYEMDEETETGVTTEVKAWNLSSILSYGVSETADIVIGLPYAGAEVQEDGNTVFDESGLADLSLELKWRFWEGRGVSLAFKPGVSFPTGNEERGLGTGRYGLFAFLIGTHELERWILHMNLGYVRNNNRVDEYEDLWHASAAAEWKASESVRFAANLGLEKNADPAAEKDPAFALVGFIYAMSEDVDVDLGYKTGLNDPETDQTLLAGMALRF